MSVRIVRSSTIIEQPYLWAKTHFQLWIEQTLWVEEYKPT